MTNIWLNKTLLVAKLYLLALVFLIALSLRFKFKL